MQWARITYSQRERAKLAKLRQRPAARSFAKWFAWYPVHDGRNWMWLETVDYTEEWLSSRVCIRRYYEGGFFEQQRERAKRDW